MPVTRNECMGAICPPNSFDLQGGLLIPRCPARRPLPLMRFHLQDDPASSSDDELPSLPDPWSVLEGPEGPDASRLPQRHGVKKVPDELAVSDESTALWGVLGAGSRSGSSVRMYGTSCAAPQIARERL